MQTSLKFGQFEVRREERRVLAHGEALPLGARAFDVLMLLIDHRDRVVGKAELLDHVWQGQVVEEANLNVQVSNLRKCLGRGPIVTIPGRGYRFTMSVEDGPAQPSLSGLSAQEPVPHSLPPVAMPAPPPLALAAPEVPHLAGPLLGRDDELAALQALLHDHRLVTTLGPGGIGKTTLALAVAHARHQSLRDGVLWVELAPVATPALLPAALAAALRVPPSAGDDPVRPLLAALRHRQLLIVLDNAEHLVEAVAALVQAVLAATVGVRFLITSQTALRLPSEQAFRLGALELPTGRPTVEEALRHGAVALFVDRARQHDRNFTLTEANLAAVIEICRRLDGVALAIELATARLPLLGLKGLQQRLGERFRLLTSGATAAPARQQTLRSALDWSYGLLPAAEQRLFRLLGVFVGGFTLELAIALAAGDDGFDEWAVIDLLDSLVNRSLVALERSGSAGGDADHPRYRLLESAREYARISLAAAGEANAAQRRHALAMLGLAEQADCALWRTPDITWLALYGPELDNVRAALEWASAHAPELAAALAGSAMPMFEYQSLRHEARRRSEPLHEQLQDPAALPPHVAGRFLMARALQSRDTSVIAQHELAMQATQAFRQAGDTVGLYEALYLVSACFQGFPNDAIAAAREMAGLARPDWPPSLRALQHIAESKALYAEGDMDANRRALEQALPLVLGSGADRLALMVLGNLADHALFVGRVHEAVLRGRELCALLRRGHRISALAFSLANLANALLQHGEVAEARESLEEALGLMRTLEWGWFRDFGEVYALLAAREARADDAARLIGWSDQAAEARGEREPNEARCRELADAAVRPLLSAERMAALMREGASMGDDAASQATLNLPPAGEVAKVA